MNRHMSATDRAYHDTRERIIDGRLGGGDIITEGQVSTALGVSRTPVREAFLRLQAEGFLELYPKRGAVVVPISPNEATSVSEARELIETFAITKLLTESDRAPQELVDSLWENITEQSRHSRAKDLPSFTAADANFHLAIVAAAQNAHLTGLYAALRDRQKRITMTTSHKLPVDLEEIVEDHQRLVRFLEEGDLDPALSIVRAHMRASRREATRRR
ncbi:transcriptional regulator, GntR family [Austwickia chelonae]|uniref:Putative GntR family transcriptional regulator n=1 Tax=Austwickia chelonae NBRC 105200 TaxID=1184607 RepID=K6W7H1_9MICO|nr:GntR family transcriptional regulator [Austwickia chelonae]GAB77777.1 putative GntR family transcriptional regulator [Austwickia chelonae NBRC 105200]SEV89292.1 transcriptional regulator, GntR family [Austwickia chelonae]